MEGSENNDKSFLIDFHLPPLSEDNEYEFDSPPVNK